MNSLKLKSVRVENGMAQKDVCKQIGMTIKTYCDSENGKRDFAISEIKKLAVIFSLNPEMVNQIFFDGELTKGLREQAATGEKLSA